MSIRPRRIDSTSRGVPLGSPPPSSHRRSRSVSVTSGFRSPAHAHQRTAREADVPALPFPSAPLPVPVAPAKTVNGEGAQVNASSARAFVPSIVRGFKDVAVATNKRELAAMFNKHKCFKYDTHRPEKVSDFPRRFVDTLR